MNEKFQSKEEKVISAYIESQFRIDKNLLSRHTRLEKYVESRIIHLRGQFKVAMDNYIAQRNTQSASSEMEDETTNDMSVEVSASQNMSATTEEEESEPEEDGSSDESNIDDRGSQNVANAGQTANVSEAEI